MLWNSLQICLFGHTVDILGNISSVNKMWLNLHCNIILIVQCGLFQNPLYNYLPFQVEHTKEECKGKYCRFSPGSKDDIVYTNDNEVIEKVRVFINSNNN